MRRRVVLFLLLLLLPLASLQAQEVLVCDGVSHFPIRDVLVIADGKNIGLTTWKGLITLPDTFQTASFKKKGYAPEKLFRSEVLRDTVFLFPAEHYLDEVVVIGKQVVDGREVFKKMDGLEDKEDPILKAYRQTQQELKADSIQKKNEEKETKR